MTVVCYSSPTDSVVLGPLDHLRSLKVILESQARCSLLDIAFSYHSLAMEHLLHELNDFCSQISFPASNLLPSICKQHNDWMMLLSSLAQLFLSTIEVRWHDVFSHVSPSCVSLPSYPFAKSKFWIPYTEDNQPVLGPIVPAALPTYLMLCSWSQYPNTENNFVAIFETLISQLLWWIVGHTVCNVPSSTVNLSTSLESGSNHSVSQDLVHNTHNNRHSRTTKAHCYRFSWRRPAKRLLL